MSATDGEERELKMAQIRADIAHKENDMAYKQGLLRFELWKVIAVAFGAGASVVIATATVTTLIVRYVTGH